MIGIDIDLLLGLAVGLVLAGLFRHIVNALIHSKSIMSYGQTCQACQTRLGPLSNIPIIGAQFSQRTCSACGHRGSPLQAVLEVLVLLFTIWSFTTLAALEALQISLLFFALLGITFFDITKWIIPNVFVFVISMVAILGMSTGVVNPLHAFQGLGVALLISGLLVLPQVLGQSENGYALGDVKFSLALGLWLGWVLAIYVFFLGSLLAFLFWIISGFFKGFSLTRPLQFGPFVALATLIFGIGRLVDPQFITHLLTFRF